MSRPPTTRKDLDSVPYRRPPAGVATLTRRLFQRRPAAAEAAAGPAPEAPAHDTDLTEFPNLPDLTDDWFADVIRQVDQASQKLKAVRRK